MNLDNAPVTSGNGFFGKADPASLVGEFGSPLYVYNETILRQRCRELKGLVNRPGFRVNFAMKANHNPELLKIVRSEGICVDVISPGELFLAKKVGFTPDEMLYVCNNVSAEELTFAHDNGVPVSVDSLAQLELYGSLFKGGKVAVRINPGVGAGHHKKVVTAGKDTKFGVNLTLLDDVRRIAETHDLTIIGLNQHIGSLFLEPSAYIEAASNMLETAESFPDLEFIDFGGGFGIPYDKRGGKPGLDLQATSAGLQKLLDEWSAKTGYSGVFMIEPGRYISAECGVLLGGVHSVKQNGEKTYVGTDVGFNVLSRPILYGSLHDMEVYPANGDANRPAERVTVVGNICESGDILAENYTMPAPRIGDVIGILDAGAYGMAMSSNYNLRLRPAEVLIKQDGTPQLVRRRDALEDLLAAYPTL